MARASKAELERLNQAAKVREVKADTVLALHRIEGAARRLRVWLDGGMVTRETAHEMFHNGLEQVVNQLRQLRGMVA